MNISVRIVRPMTPLPEGTRGWLLARPFAHRGLHDKSAGVPENSLTAFQRAAEAGYGAELDVRLSADGQPIVFHDKHLNRLTGLDGRLSRRAARELSSLRLGGTNEHIPRLGDVLRLIDGRIPLLVELKNESVFSRRLEKAVWPLLRAYRGPVAVQSFNPFSLRWFRRHAPGIVRGQLARRRKKFPTLGHLRLVSLSRPHYIGFFMGDILRGDTARLRAGGAVVLGWTAHTQAQWEACRAHADNIIFEGYAPPIPPRG